MNRSQTSMPRSEHLSILKTLLLLSYSVVSVQSQSQPASPSSSSPSSVSSSPWSSLSLIPSTFRQNASSASKATSLNSSNTSSNFSTITWTYPFSSAVDQSINTNKNGSGSAYAFACWAATLSFSSSVSELVANASKTYYDTFTSTFTSTSYLYDVWTTDCDGMPHARGTAPIASSTVLNYSTFTHFTRTEVVSWWTSAKPSCVIDASDCSYLWSSYAQELSAFNSFSKTLTSPAILKNTPETPSCKTLCTQEPYCMIMGDHVQLFYWPVTTTGANSCRASGTTVPSNFNGTRTAVVDGRTYTSPWVYISFHALSAFDWSCSTTIGEPVLNTIVSILPKDLSSARGWHLGRSAKSFNLADLNGFVTSAAYCQAQVYDWASCNVILDEQYHPTLWMPDAVLTMRPEWAGCDRSIFGINDPPYALPSVTAILDSSPDSPTSAPAKPKSKADPPYIPMTASLQNAQSTGLPTSPNDFNPPDSGTSNGIAQLDPVSSVDLGWKAFGDYIASMFGIPPSEKNTLTSASSAQATKMPTPPTQPQIVSIGSAGVVVDGTVTLPFFAFLSQVEGNRAHEVTTQGFSATWSTTPFAIVPTTDDSGRTFVGVGGKTLQVSDDPVTVSGHSMTAAAGGLVIDGSVTVPFASKSSSAMELATSSMVASDATITKSESGNRGAVSVTPRSSTRSGAQRRGVQRSLIWFNLSIVFPIIALYGL